MFFRWWAQQQPVSHTCKSNPHHKENTQLATVKLHVPSTRSLNCIFRYCMPEAWAMTHEPSRGAHLLDPKDDRPPKFALALARRRRRRSLLLAVDNNLHSGTFRQLFSPCDQFGIFLGDDQRRKQRSMFFVCVFGVSNGLRDAEETKTNKRRFFREENFLYRKAPPALPQGRNTFFSRIKCWDIQISLWLMTQ